MPLLFLHSLHKHCCDIRILNSFISFFISSYKFWKYLLNLLCYESNLFPLWEITIRKFSNPPIKGNSPKFLDCIKRGSNGCNVFLESEI